MTAPGALVATLAVAVLPVIAHGPDRAALQPPPIAR